MALICSVITTPQKRCLTSKARQIKHVRAI